MFFEKLPRFDHEIIFVDDRSTDATYDILESLSAAIPNIFYISFSGNFGKDNALIAGLQYTAGDASITMDADFQLFLRGLIKMGRIQTKSHRILCKRKICRL